MTCHWQVLGDAVNFDSAYAKNNSPPTVAMEWAFRPTLECVPLGKGIVVRVRPAREI